MAEQHRGAHALGDRVHSNPVGLEPQMLGFLHW